MGTNTRHILSEYFPGLIVILITLLSAPKADAQELSVGDEYGGGIVAYIFEPEDPGYIEGETHGILIAKENQAEATPWSNINSKSSGAKSKVIGSGPSNTQLITSQSEHTNSAAYLCQNYEIDGFNDWFLPSFDELVAIVKSSEIVPSGAYWTSSELKKNKVYVIVSISENKKYSREIKKKEVSLKHRTKNPFYVRSNSWSGRMSDMIVGGAYNNSPYRTHILDINTRAIRYF